MVWLDGWLSGLPQHPALTVAAVIVVGIRNEFYARLSERKLLGPFQDLSNSRCLAGATRWNVGGRILLVNCSVGRYLPRLTYLCAD